MRLTLRTLIAWLDDTLTPTEVREIGQQVAESPFAKELVERVQRVTRQRRLTVPGDSGPDATDPNLVASYLDNELDARAGGRVREAVPDLRRPPGRGRQRPPDPQPDRPEGQGPARRQAPDVSPGPGPRDLEPRPTPRPRPEAGLGDAEGRRHRADRRPGPSVDPPAVARSSSGSGPPPLVLGLIGLLVLAAAYSLKPETPPATVALDRAARARRNRAGRARRPGRPAASRRRPRRRRAPPAAEPSPSPRPRPAEAPGPTRPASFEAIQGVVLQANADGNGWDRVEAKAPLKEPDPAAQPGPVPQHPEARQGRGRPGRLDRRRPRRRPRRTSPPGSS